MRSCGGAFTIVRPDKYGCATHREKGICTNASQISARQLERRVLAGIKMQLSQPELVAEFVREFYSELQRLQADSANLGSESKKKLDDMKRRIDRIIGAIADGTDTPSLRRALLSLESEKVELESAMVPPALLNRRRFQILNSSYDQRLKCLNKTSVTTRRSQPKQLPFCGP